METKRRQLLSLLMGLPLFGLLFSAKNISTKATLALTPPCDDHPELTPPQMEGPYFKPQSPQRTILRQDGMQGTTMIITGQVLNTNCQPVAHALLDFWHADDAGTYDNSGFSLRGHQFTDAQGNFGLETIVPGLYTGRTRHIHVKVQAPGKSILTTQLYFPEEQPNKRDRLFNEVLLLKVSKNQPKMLAQYTFVVQA